MSENKNLQPDDVGRLLSAAGPGPVPSPAARSAAKQAARAAWEVRTATWTARRRHRRRQVLALAAVLLTALGVWLLPRPEAPGPGGATPPIETIRVATVEGLWNAVLVRPAAGGAGPLHPGGDVAADATLDTGADGRVALRLASGHAVRLDVGTRARIGEDGQLFLEDGAVYVDSAGADPQASVDVHVALGVVHEIGTRFEVRLDEGALHVRVRDGAVDVEVGDERHAAAAGAALTVHGDGHVERAALASWAEAWNWVVDSSPPFALEGRTVAEMLAWVVHETGWQVAYADAALEREVAGIVIHSSVEGLRPDQAPALVLPTSGLDFELDNGRLLVKRP